MMQSDLTLLVRKCARGKNVISSVWYRQFSSHAQFHTCVHFGAPLVLSKAVCCVEMVTELSYHDVVSCKGILHSSFCYPVVYIMCVRTYTPIHNVLAEATCCFTLNFHYDVWLLEH